MPSRTTTFEHLTDFRPVVATRLGLQGSLSAPQIADRAISSVAADGRDLWLLVDRVELHRVRDGDTQQVARLESGSGTCVHVHAGMVWVGGDEAALWRLADGVLEPVESFRRAPTRDAWSTPWGGPPAVFSMASHGDDLYVSVHVGGIIRTSDGGRSWTATIDLDDDVHQVAVGPDGTVWAATGHSGLASSRDRGETWSYHTEGLHGTYLLAVAVSTAGVLVGASSGHASRDGAVYLFDGARFERLGLLNAMDGAVGPRQLSASGNHAALAAPGGSVFASADGGRTWSLHDDALPPVSEVLVLEPTPAP